LRAVPATGRLEIDHDYYSIDDREVPLMSNFLPYLFLLACPLMMVFMMRGMNHGVGGHSGMAAAGDSHDPAAHWDARDDRLTELEREVSDLRAECARLRTESR
jgi:hypothetical protein